MRISRWVSLPIFLLCAAISIFWGSSFSRSRYGTTDFRAVYYGTRCLLQHHNPYHVSELEQVVKDENGERPSETFQQHQAVTLYVNLPSTFIFVVPFAVLPIEVAQFLWLTLLAVLFLISSYLIWKMSEYYAPRASLFLVCVVLANSLVLFSGANTAGVAVPLCAIAAVSFLQGRFVPAGIVCMALSLAMKPHDSGFVWLYFLLLGGAYRRRALQALLGAVALGISGIVWVTLIAPHWITYWRANLALISTHGYINDPSPSSVVGFDNLAPVIDLQSIISLFRDDPRVYNPVSYAVCGVLLLIWAIRTVKVRPSSDSMLIGLATAVPLTMLITYHRPWDAKLLLLTVPACALLCSNAGSKRWLPFSINSAAFILAGDIPMAASKILLGKLHLPSTGWLGMASTIILLRPITVALLIMSAYYLWVYTRDSMPRHACADQEEFTQKPETTAGFR